MKNPKFREAFMNLPRANNEHVKIRKKIEETCEISSAVFYNWNTGVTKVPHWAKEKIAKIMNKKVTELF